MNRTGRGSLKAGLLAAALLCAPMAAAMAGANDPLFINLISDDGHRINMALGFGGAQHANGHKLTVFMNDRAVLAASKVNQKKFSGQHAKIQELLDKGATILVCPGCMKHYGVKETDLLPGLKIGMPDVTGAALFQDNTKTLTW